MVNILGYELHKKPKPVNSTPVIPKEAIKSFESYMEDMRKTTGRSDADILKQTFNNPWIGLNVEETDSFLRMDAQALGKDKDIDESKKDPIEECIRLRHNFAPVSACVDYVKQELLGGGIDTVIKDTKDKIQKDMRTDIEKLIANVYQDDLIIGLDIIMPILVDYALTTGVGAAEIAYAIDKSFWNYVKISEPQKVTVDNKLVEIVDFDIIEPSWEELKGIKRLKIYKDGYKLFEPQRDNKSMEIKYWVVDDKNNQSVTLSNGQKFRRLDSTKNNQGLYLHNWQLFYLTINKNDYSAKGESIILPALGIAKMLEKILAAVGEGTSRAGFKRFFIIMGSEKRPWGGPFIRNVLQQMKEARDKNWQTIPMPQGFDIKEMGGEVFDAKEVVDYLLKMLAKAMNVPTKVVGVTVGSGTGGIEDPNNYRIWKNNLCSSLRNQLYKRHLWALHGNKRKKQGGGEDDTYIPFARINVEELLTLKERTELFKAIMNFANPVDPLMKWKAQTEYCKVMGWEDVLEELPTLEEYKKDLDKQKKLQEKMVLDKAKVDAQPPKEEAPIGEKQQGQPVPPNEEQLKKRQDAGVNVRKVDSKKGVKASIEETLAEPIEPLPQRVEITVNTKNEPQKLEITTKTTPQEILMKNEPQKLTVNFEPIVVKTETPLDGIFKELTELQKIEAIKQTELIEKQKLLAEETDKENKIKLYEQVKQIEENLKLTQAEIKRKESETEKFNAETEKFKIESEEIKKTHEKKREAINKIENKG
jgi:hypothetical protein